MTWGALCGSSKRDWWLSRLPLLASRRQQTQAKFWHCKGSLYRTVLCSKAFLKDFFSTRRQIVLAFLYARAEEKMIWARNVAQGSNNPLLPLGLLYAEIFSQQFCPFTGYASAHKPFCWEVKASSGPQKLWAIICAGTCLSLRSQNWPSLLEQTAPRRRMHTRAPAVRQTLSQHRG